ncbi:reverse transcriptase domain-containing protein [Tanacetum coccineum]
MARTPLNENCSAVILNKLPKKLGDPGRFLIPCEFSGINTCNALADLGASINLMPYSVWKDLSLPELTPTCMTLELADRSITEPIGIAKDVRLMVGKFQFPADFVVVDFEPDPRVPLILGRSFLKTSRALIDVYEGEITLRRVGKRPSPSIGPNIRDSTDGLLILEALLNSEPLPPLPNHKDYSPGIREELKVVEAKTVKSSIDEPPEVELKDLPPHLEYAFLEGNDKLPVIIAKDLKGMIEKAALIQVLKSPQASHQLGNSRYQKLNQSFVPQNPMEEKLSQPSQYLSSRVKDGRDESNSFNTLKRKLTEAPILIAPDWDLPFELMCDASNFAIGAVLGQRKNKHFQPIHYASKTMTKAQAHYTMTEKELLAVVYAFEKFQSYLVLSKSINVDVEYPRQKKAQNNLAADHLSRLENPHQNEFENKEITETFPLETLGSVALRDDNTPWFADFANYHAGNFIVKGMSSQQKKQCFFKMSNNTYFWDDPYSIQDLC